MNNKYKRIAETKEQILRRIDVAAVVGRYVALKRAGRELVGLCPFHDEKTPSFSLSPTKGIYHCFGCGAGGDIFTFVQAINGVDFRAAVDILADEVGIRAGTDGPVPTPKPSRRVADRTRKPAVPSGLKMCIPAPNNAPPPPPSLNVAKKGEKEKYLRPSSIYKYTDASGAVIRYIYRFDPTPENGLDKKQFRPVICHRDKSGRLIWQSWRDIPDNRPLYGLEALAENHTAPVLVVSGEKCADAARPKLPEYVVITWSGGDQGIEKTDFSPLKGRDITWWPDNDNVGKKSMRRLSMQLGGQVLDIPPNKYTKGWDCADAVEEGLDLSELISSFKSAIIGGVDGKYPDLSMTAPDGIFTDYSEKGTKLHTITNVTALMNYYGLRVWYDEVTKRLDCSIAGKESKDGDRMNNFRTLVRDKCVLNGIPFIGFNETISYIASEHRRNPVVEWINSRAWDGVHRVQQVIDSVVCDSDMDVKLKDVMMLKWMVSAYAAVSRVDGDTFRTRGMLVFQGKQEVGKTSFVKMLCGEKYGGDERWYGEGGSLNPDSVDNIIRANRFWFYEFAELEKTTKFSMSGLKAFLTNPVNTVRFKYAREETMIWNRTVYAGTVNQMSFLPDMTGNSRFWCMPVVSLNDISDIDMQQVWAEIKRYHDVCVAEGAKYIWWLSPEESAALEKSNERHESPSSAGDLLGECLDWEANKRLWREATCTQLLIDCGIREDATKSLVTAAGIYLHRMGLTARHNGRSRVYFAPPKKFINNGAADESIAVNPLLPQIRQQDVFE